MKVLILAGGLGTRIRALFPELPKPLAPVLGKPFLEWQVDVLVRQGFTDVVLCLGYRADRIVAHFGDGAAWGARIEHSVEREPLGTGGALRLAAPHLESTALVLNGDTFLDADYVALAEQHGALVATAGARASLCLVEVEDSRAYGRVRLGPDGRVTGFEEKPAVLVGGLVNAGAYFVEPGVASAISAERSVSLEREVFVALVGRQQLFGLRADRPFVDMGTPEGHARMTALLSAADRQP